MLNLEITKEKMAKKKIAKKKIAKKKAKSSGRWQRIVIGLFMALIMIGSIFAVLTL